jgi:hypothetical protein
MGIAVVLSGDFSDPYASTMVILISRETVFKNLWEKMARV